MKEIFEKQPRKKIEEAKNVVLLDTCFFIHTFEHQKDAKLRELMQKTEVAMTSFNVEEFLFKEHVVDERVREHARKFLKNNKLTIIDVPVHPGQYESEKIFVRSVDNELLKDISDTSDAVIIAVAVKTNSNILTKDKHHLFTVKLENYLNKYGIQVHKEFHDII